MSTGLAGRVALVTGVSRAQGIGAAVVRRLLDEGCSVVAQGWPDHDREQPWGADAGHGIEAPPERFRWLERDLADARVAQSLVADATAALAPPDLLVVAHARSSQQSLADVTVDELDRSWAVNARAVVLLVQAFAAALAGRPGRAVLFTSGQHLGPMPDEIPYALTKGAVQQITATLADALADAGVTLNCLNPGPTDTGWATPEQAREVGRALPRGRWGTPEEAAAVVAWLLSDDAASVTGQVIDAEGGFRRWAR